jgi:hypothetical protein
LKRDRKLGGTEAGKLGSWEAGRLGGWEAGKPGEHETYCIIGLSSSASVTCYINLAWVGYKPTHWCGALASKLSSLQASQHYLYFYYPSINFHGPVRIVCSLIIVNPSSKL